MHSRFRKHRDSSPRRKSDRAPSGERRKNSGERRRGSAERHKSKSLKDKDRDDSRERRRSERKERKERERREHSAEVNLDNGCRNLTRLKFSDF